MISIIIPHKNSTSLLKRLLDSCTSVHHIQVIVIDDNSTLKEKDCLKVLHDEYSFELYDSLGMGAGAARNMGLQYAKGKWIFFADADDFFSESFSLAINKHYDDNCDIIYYNVTSCYSETLKKAYRDSHIKSLINKYNKTGDEGYLRCGYTVPWGKMFCTEFLTRNKFEFEEIIAGNDMMFSVLTGIKASKIICDPVEIYCNTVTSGSITTTLSKEHFESRFQATLRVNNLLRKEHLHKFQISVLYFIAKSYQFGIVYFMSSIKSCIWNRSNLFIGLSKLFCYKDVIKDRQNPQLIHKRLNDNVYKDITSINKN